ncbi:hypothetical protein C8R45DRAFT_928908 [Mycena sanguinolenta]|nr:hypothetical protein C8R45DRAFT_928908 [Mycena sanguinolenta]
MRRPAPPKLAALAPCQRAIRLLITRMRTVPVAKQRVPHCQQVVRKKIIGNAVQMEGNTRATLDELEAMSGNCQHQTFDKNLLILYKTEKDRKTRQNVKRSKDQKLRAGNHKLTFPAKDICFSAGFQTVDSEHGEEFGNNSNGKHPNESASVRPEREPCGVRTGAAQTSLEEKGSSLFRFDQRFTGCHPSPQLFTAHSVHTSAEAVTGKVIRTHMGLKKAPEIMIIVLQTGRIGVFGCSRHGQREEEEMKLVKLSKAWASAPSALRKIAAQYFLIPQTLTALGPGTFLKLRSRRLKLSPVFAIFVPPIQPFMPRSRRRLRQGKPDHGDGEDPYQGADV